MIRSQRETVVAVVVMVAVAVLAVLTFKLTAFVRIFFFLVFQRFSKQVQRKLTSCNGTAFCSCAHDKKY